MEQDVGFILDAVLRISNSRWEYTTAESGFNELGAAGWELVALVPSASGPFVGHFKRRKQEP